MAAKKLGSRSKKPIRQTRIKIHLPNEDRYGEFRGIILYADFAQMDGLYLPAQILTLSSSGERKFILLEKMTDEDIKNVTGKFEVFAHNEKEYKEATQHLQQLGKKLEDKINRLPATAINKDGKLEVDTEGIMDSVIFRNIAKIAFNYLAKTKSAEYALAPKFDVIRNYIITGNKPTSKLVAIERGHILADETNKKYFLEGHIFTTETRGSAVISKMSLTNMFNFYYVVHLGDLGPMWHDIKSGHAYSLKEDRIIPLFSPTYLTITSKLKRIFGYPRT